MRNAACLLLTDHNCSDGATRWHLCQKGIASSLNLLPISSIVDRCRQNGVCYKSFKAHQGMLFMLFMLSVNFMWGTRFPVRGFLSQLHGSLTSNLPLGVVLNVKMRGFPCFSRPSIYIYNIYLKKIYIHISEVYIHFEGMHLLRYMAGHHLVPWHFRVCFTRRCMALPGWSVSTCFVPFLKVSDLYKLYN